MAKQRVFPQVLKGAATAASKNAQRTGEGGRKIKKPTMPKMPWDDEKEIEKEEKEK